MRAGVLFSAGLVAALATTALLGASSNPGAGGGGWTGTATSTLDMAGYNITGATWPLASKVFADSPVALASSNAILLCDATNGVVVFNAPAAASHTGRIYTVKKIDSSANSCTFDPNAAETVDGAATKTNTTQYQSFDFISNGTSWFIL